MKSMLREGEVMERRHEDEPDLVGEPREEPGAHVHDLVELAGSGDLLVDRATLVLGQPAGLHQVIDVEAVAAVGRDAPGRGVRLMEVAEVLEIRHHVPEGRGRELEGARLRERTGTDRLAARDVDPDDLVEDVPETQVEFFFGALVAVGHHV